MLKNKKEKSSKLFELFFIHTFYLKKKNRYDNFSTQLILVAIHPNSQCSKLCVDAKSTIDSTILSKNF